MQTVPAPALSPEDRCAQEPIHIIGRIQDHGLLFALSEPDLVVRAAGANASNVLGLPLDAIVGASFESVLGVVPFAAHCASVSDRASVRCFASPIGPTTCSS